MTTKEQETYWTTRYREQRTGWDIGYPSTPLREYIDQLTNKNLKILIPGAGNAYEAQYLYEQGFDQVHVLDISRIPLAALQERIPEFPKKQLLHGDFFQHAGQYDLILEQTFFCALEPTPDNRARYAAKMRELLRPGGKLVGLWFNHPLVKEGARPFGGNREEYLSYLTPYFEVQVFEACRNSIGPRQGNELFGVFRRSNK